MARKPMLPLVPTLLWLSGILAAEPGEVLKAHVVSEAQAGRPVTLAVRLGPSEPVPARITRADAAGVALNAQGLAVDLPWAKLEQQDLYELYRPMIAQSPAPVRAAYLRLGLRSGRQKEKGFENILVGLWQDDAATAKEIEAELSAPATPAAAPAAAPRNGASKPDAPAASAEDLPLPALGELGEPAPDVPSTAADWDQGLFVNGKVNRSAYLRACASMEAGDVSRRLGPDWAVYRNGQKPDVAKEPTVDGFGLDEVRHTDGEYIWKQKGDKPVDWTGGGGQVFYVPDDPKASGVDKLMFYWSYHENHGGQHLWHVYRLRPGIGKDGGEWWSGSPDPCLKNREFVAASKSDPIRVPSVIARGRCAWSNFAVIAFRNGVVVTSGTGNNGGDPGVVACLPPGKVPTAAAVTPNNEIALLTVWDVRELKGQLAVLALCPQGRPWMTPTAGFYSGIKLLGFVDLPIAAPTALSATTDTAASDGFGSDLKPEDFDFGKAEVRAKWASGPAGGTRNVVTSYPRRGYALVASRAEGKLVFVDLAPLLTHVRNLYFSSQENYARTLSAGPAANQWPFAFDQAPEARPKVVQTIPIPQPTAVATGLPFERGFGTQAVVTTMDGRVGLLDVGALASEKSTDGVRILGTGQIGRNPTCLAYGTRVLRPVNSFVATCRGDREVVWFKTAGRQIEVIKRLRDARLLDPVWIEPGDTRGAICWTVADFAGKRVINYLTQPIDVWGDKVFGGLGKDGQAPFECSGWLSLPGRPFMLSAAEVP